MEPIASVDLAHYRAIFLTAETPRGAGVSGQVGVRVFAQSHLPTEELARIWELADLDADGRLSLDEFCIAMHLVTRRVAGDSIPNRLPSALLPPFAWDDAARVADSLAGVASPSPPARSRGAVADAPTGASPPSSHHAEHGSTERGWRMSADEKAKYDGVFHTMLRSSAGSYVEGDTARRFLCRSNLPTEELARIWELADLDADGRLTRQEFAIAMHLVTRRVAGYSIPATVPPSLLGVVSPPAQLPVKSLQQPAPGPMLSSALDDAPRSLKAVSFAEELAADAFGDTEELAVLAGGGYLARPGRAGSPPFGLGPSASNDGRTGGEAGAADDWLLVEDNNNNTSSRTGAVAAELAALDRAAAATHAMAERRLAASLEGHSAIKEQVLVATAQLLTRGREAEEAELRLEAVEAQRGACHREQEWCAKRLGALQLRCGESDALLREKHHEVQLAQAELKQVAEEVSAAQAGLNASLEYAQGLTASLEHARAEARALKQAEALLQQRARLVSKQSAPVRCELAQLHADIAILEEKVKESAVQESDDNPQERAVELAEVLSQIAQAQLQQQRYQKELHAVVLNREDRAATEASTLAVKRLELQRLVEESARAEASQRALRSLQL